jgi:hypothetical protein
VTPRLGSVPSRSVGDAFTATASIRAVEETLARSPSGALSPAAAFGADFVLTIPRHQPDRHDPRGNAASRKAVKGMPSANR